MTEELSYKDNKVLATEVSGNRLANDVQLVTSLEQQSNTLDVYKFRDFLATLDGIKFSPVTFDNKEVAGASFLFSDENNIKIGNARYTLSVCFSYPDQ